MSIASVRVARLRRRSSGRRLGRPVEHPHPRQGVTHDPGHGGPRFQDRPAGRRYRPGHRTQDAADHGRGQVVDALSHQVIGREVLRDGQRGRRLGRRVALEVVDLREHLHAADAVGDGVADVQQRRGLSVGQTLDQGRRPQRPGDVHRRLQDHLGEVEDVTQRAGFGDPHPAHMEFEVEIGVHHPARRRRRQGRHDHLLPQPQHPSGGVFESGQELIPVRRGVEEFQRHDPRPSPGIRFASMHQIVDRSELVGQLHDLDGLSHGPPPDAPTVSRKIKPPASDPPTQ